MGLHVAVRVPPAVAAAGVADLDEADALLRQPPRQQQLPAEFVRLLLADAVELLARARARSEKSTTSGADSCMRAASS